MKDIYKDIVSFDDRSDEVQDFLDSLKAYGWRICPIVDDIDAVAQQLRHLDHAVALIDLFWEGDGDSWQGFRHLDFLKERNIYPAPVVFSRFREAHYVTGAFARGAVDYLTKDVLNDEILASGFGKLESWYCHRLEVALMRQLLRRKRNFLFSNDRFDSGIETGAIGHMLSDAIDWFCNGDGFAYVAINDESGGFRIISCKEHEGTIRLDSQPIPTFRKFYIPTVDSFGRQFVNVPLFWTRNQSNVHRTEIGHLCISAKSLYPSEAWFRPDGSISEYTQLVLSEFADCIVDLLTTSASQLVFVPKTVRS